MGKLKICKESDPGGILTHDLQNRNLTFYTAELQGHFSAKLHFFSEMNNYFAFEKSKVQFHIFQKLFLSKFRKSSVIRFMVISIN